MPCQHPNQWLCQKWALAFPSCPPQRIWGEQGQSSVTENMSFCLCCSSETRVWGSSGKALGFGLLLFDINVLQMGLSADHFVQRRYCCQRWGSLCSFPLVLVEEDCLTNGSPRCLYCAFSLNLVSIPYFLCLTFPRKNMYIFGHLKP